MLSESQRKRLRELVATADAAFQRYSFTPQLVARWERLRPRLDPDHLDFCTTPEERREIMQEAHSLSAALAWEAHQSRSLRDRGRTRAEVELLDPTRCTAP